MTVFVALLRGINVGGRHKLPMQVLRGIIEGAGGKDVSTYIQSGNAVFRSAKAGASSLESKIAAAVEREAGFKPEIFAVDLAAYKTVLKNNPFAASCADPSKQFVVFLKAAARAGALDGAEKLLANGERIKAKGKAIYFDAPQGIGRSKAAEALARSGAGGTMRNWRTCLTLEEMADALAAA